MPFVRNSSTGPMMASDRKSTRLNSSHLGISYAVFCLKKKNKKKTTKDMLFDGGYLGLLICDNAPQSAAHAGPVCRTAICDSFFCGSFFFFFLKQAAPPEFPPLPPPAPFPT